MNSYNVQSSLISFPSSPFCPHKKDGADGQVSASYSSKSVQTVDGRRHLPGKAVVQGIKKFAHCAWKTLMVIPATAVKSLLNGAWSGLSSGFKAVKAAFGAAQKGAFAGVVAGATASAVACFAVGMSAGPVIAVPAAIAGGVVGAGAGGLIGAGTGAAIKLGQQFHQKRIDQAKQNAIQANPNKTAYATDYYTKGNVQ